MRVLFFELFLSGFCLSIFVGFPFVEGSSEVHIGLLIEEFFELSHLSAIFGITMIRNCKIINSMLQEVFPHKFGQLSQTLRSISSHLSPNVEKMSDFWHNEIFVFIFDKFSYIVLNQFTFFLLLFL